VEKREEFLKRGDGLKLTDDLKDFREPQAGECFIGLASGESPPKIVQAGPFSFDLDKAELEKKVRIPGEAPRLLAEVLQAGDVLQVCLSSEPEEAKNRIVHQLDRPWAEGAAVVLENRTGHVIALTGGYSVGLEGFIRATQARRQPGSSFKPYVYGAAIHAGHRQTDIIVDGPFSMIGTNGLPWSPQNYDGSYHGPVPLRTAIALSLNTVAVRLGVEVGIEQVTRLAASLGVRSPLRKDMTVVLGSSEVTPMDMAVAYSSIARGGIRIEPVFVSRVLDRNARILATEGDRIEILGEERELPGAPGVRAMGAGDAYVLVDMMRNVFLAGTAKKGQRKGMDFAGKTGTTSGFIDTWFVGYSPRYTVAVWIGTDGTTSIGDKETGGKTALPVWSRIMDVLPNVAGERFPVPDEAILLQEGDSWLGFVRGNVPPGKLPAYSVDSLALPPFGLSRPTAQQEMTEEIVQ
jgi:penicillin-binding protein 1A